LNTGLKGIEKTLQPSQGLRQLLTITSTNGLNLGSSNATTLAFANGGSQIEFGSSVTETSSSVTINTSVATTALGNGILYLKSIIGNAASNGGTYYGLNSSGAFTNNWANNSTFFGSSFRNAITANGAGTSSVTIYHARPTINATAGATTVSGYTYDPAETNLTGVTHYGFRSTSLTATNGFGTSTPNSLVHVNGSWAGAYVAKTANYTATISDYLINCTSNSFTVTLPTAVGIQGRVYIIKNTGAGTITLATTSGETIDGAAPGSLAAGPTQISIMSTNAGWITF